MEKIHYLNESEWLHYGKLKVPGESFTSSMLYRPGDGLFCCLGLYGRDVGVPLEEMTCRSFPSNVYEKYRHLFAVCLLDDGIAVELVYLNDYPLAMFETMSDRQMKIVAKFKEYGIHVQFVTTNQQCNERSTTI